MDNNNITQLHNITPEEFKKEILHGVSQLLSEYQKNLGLYDQNTFICKVFSLTLYCVKRGTIPETSIDGRVVYNLAEVKEALKKNNLQD